MGENVKAVPSMRPKPADLTRGLICVSIYMQHACSRIMRRGTELKEVSWVEDEVVGAAGARDAARGVWVAARPPDREAIVFAPIVGTGCRTRWASLVMNENARAAAQP